MRKIFAAMLPLVAATAAQAQLAGTSIDASYRWPDLETAQPGVVFEPASFVVDSGFESIATGTFFTATVNFTDTGFSMLFLIGGPVPTDGVWFAPLPFHGFVFEGDGFLDFAGATLLGSTTVDDPNFDASDVVLAGNRLTVNVGGVEIHNWQRIDIGFEPVQSAVPEPASWAMMIAGFGIVGAASRRRRRAHATFAA